MHPPRRSDSAFRINIWAEDVIVDVDVAMELAYCLFLVTAYPIYHVAPWNLVPVPQYGTFFELHMSGQIRICFGVSPPALQNFFPRFYEVRCICNYEMGSAACEANMQKQPCFGRLDTSVGRGGGGNKGDVAHPDPYNIFPPHSKAQYLHT